MRPVVESEAEGRQKRRSVGKAGDVRIARIGLGDRAEAGALAIGPGLAVARDAHDDQARIDGHEYIRSDAPFLERPGAVVLEQDIGVLYEPLHDLDAERRAHVGGDRALAAVDHLEIEADAVLALAPVADFVAAARSLDLDDVGTPVRKVHPAKRCGEKARDIDDLHAGERL